MPALQRLADQLASRLGILKRRPAARLPAGQLRFADWEAAIDTLLGPQAGGGVIVIDELPYLYAIVRSSRRSSSTPLTAVATATIGRYG